MNTTSERNGLSARRKTSTVFKKIIFRAKPFSVFLVAAPLLISSCHEKTNGQDKAERKTGSASVVRDSLNEPKVNIKVNKRYDDKGNVIGFDSTYTSYYSNIQGDTSRMDSLMKSFDTYFNRDHSTFFGKEFKSLFFNDSSRYPDFFHDDFLLKRYELNDSYFRDMMDRMDSIKNRFYQDYIEKRNHSKDL